MTSNPYALPFHADYTKAHNGDTFAESNRGVACAICGRRPCLRVVGSKAFCSRHAAEAWAEAKRVMGTRVEKHCD
jgi:hypothetical protein